MKSFDIVSDYEEGLLDEVVVKANRHHRHYSSQQHLQQHHHQHHHHQYDPLDSPIHFCDKSLHSDDNSFSHHQQQIQHCASLDGDGTRSSCSTSTLNTIGRTSMNTNESSSSVGSTPTTIIYHEDAVFQSSHDEIDVVKNNNVLLSTLPVAGQLQHQQQHQIQQQQVIANSIAQSLCSSSSCSSSSSASSQSSSGGSYSHAVSNGASFNHQLTADICNYKNSKSRRLEYSLKCLKYGRSNPSQDSAFGSLTDGDLSIGSSSFRLSSFQSISSPIDEGVEDIIIATTTAGNETCLELATIPTSSIVSNDSAISTPCRDGSPNNFLIIDEPSTPVPIINFPSIPSTSSTVNNSTPCIRPQQFPVSLSPKIFVTTNSSSSSLSSTANLQFDPPKILVNDQNSIYTTSPSKRSGTIEVFSQKYRVCSFEDMSPSKRTASGSSKNLRNVNRMAFRSLEEERRIDSAFIPIIDRTSSDNRVNINSEKYKKLTHSSFRISKTTSQMTVHETGIISGCGSTSSPASTTAIAGMGVCSPNASNNCRVQTESSSSASRQTMWRDSKFYRKNRIAKSNDSLLESSPNHSARLSPSSFRDNHYDSGHHSRQSLNRGCSANEISGSIPNGGLNYGNRGLTVNSNTTGNRRYCSSKSEELCDVRNETLRVIDSRMSYSERHLFTTSKLKQTAITLATTNISDQCCLSEDESLQNDNNMHQQYRHHYTNNYHQSSSHQSPQFQQHQKQKYNICHRNSHHTNHHSESYNQKLSISSCSINRMTKTKTTSLATLSCHNNLGGMTSSALSVSKQKSARNSVFKSLDIALNYIDSHGSDDPGGSETEENSSADDESPSQNISCISGVELSRIFAMDETAQNSSCSEEKTPLLDSVEMSPMSPIEPDLNQM